MLCVILFSLEYKHTNEMTLCRIYTISQKTNGGNIMRKKFRFKKFMALFLSVFMLSSMTANAAPGSADLTFDTLGSKTAEALVKPGQYEITLGVPGALETEEYLGIIHLMD